MGVGSIGGLSLVSETSAQCFSTTAKDSNPEVKTIAVVEYTNIKTPACMKAPAQKA